MNPTAGSSETVISLEGDPPALAYSSTSARPLPRSRSNAAKAVKLPGKKKRRRLENLIQVLEEESRNSRETDSRDGLVPPAPTKPVFTSSALSNLGSDRLPLSPTQVDLLSEENGRFSVPLKGVKRTLRSALTGGSGHSNDIGGRAEEVIGLVERELVEWLEATGGSTASRMTVTNRVVDPTPFEVQTSPASSLEFEQSGPLESIVEVSRSPWSLVWHVPDNYTRFLLHCVARYYKVTSFSKTELSSQRRLTHLLRPNEGLKKSARASLETPPTTDWSSATEHESIYADSEEIYEDSETETSTQGDLSGDETEAPPVPSVVPADNGSSSTIGARSGTTRLRPSRLTLPEIESGDEVDLSASAEESPAESPANAGEGLEISLSDLSLARTDSDHSGLDKEEGDDDGRSRAPERIVRASPRHGSAASSPSHSPVRSRRVSLGRGRSRIQALRPRTGLGKGKQWRMPIRPVIDWVLD